MRNFTKDLLRKVAEIHHAIQLDGSQRDGEEGVHFNLKIQLFTPAANRVYHERLVELLMPQPPATSSVAQLMAPKASSPAVDAKAIIAAVKARKPAPKKRKR